MSAIAAAALRRTVVLEGCDGTGKSTLAAHLTRRSGFSVVHCVPTPGGIDLAERYRDVLRQTGRLVLDRCFVSELVYGPLRRGRSRLTWAQALDLTEAVAARDGVFLHLTGPPALLRARLIRRDGTAESLSELTDIVSGYQRVFERLSGHAPVVRLLYGPGRSAEPGEA